MINKKEDSERKVIFLDIDGVMQPCCNENRFRHDIRQTQKDVAEKIGVAQPTVNQKINNIRPMDLQEAEAIADLLKISPREFVEYFFT